MPDKFVQLFGSVLMMVNIVDNGVESGSLLTGCAPDSG